MMFMAGDNPVGALLDPLSMIVLVVSTKTGANSLDVETKPAAGSVNAETVAETSGTVIMIASEAKGAATNSTILGSPVHRLKFKLRYPLH